MRYSRGFSLLVAAAVVVTLSAKAVGSRPPPRADPDLFSRTAGSVLREAGMVTSVSRVGSGVYTYGRRDGCLMMVAERDAYGTFADRIAQFARPVGPMRYVWRGRTHDAFPKAAVLTDFLVHREIVRLGFNPKRHPVVAVAANGGCGDVRPDWTPLRSLPI